MVKELEKKNLSVKVYNQEGKESGELNLNEKIFGIKPKESVVHQVYVSICANLREPWADTKNKGEVRGGGRKPWKQKGTGRARHGSIRSPIWKGGGITFGPLSTRNYKQKINKSMNQLATLMCLSDKVNDGKLLIVDSLPTENKTKVLANWLKQLPCVNRKTLLLLSKVDENLNRATRNLQKLFLKKAVDVSVKDLLRNQYVLITKDGLEQLEKRLLK